MHEAKVLLRGIPFDCGPVRLPATNTLASMTLALLFPEEGEMIDEFRLVFPLRPSKHLTPAIPVELRLCFIVVGSPPISIHCPFSLSHPICICP